MDLATRLAEYAVGLEYSKLDFGTVKQMKARVVDAVGCAIGAFGEPPLEMARRATKRMRPGGRSTILGTEDKSQADLATFVNGFMVRYFDFNDTYLSKEPAHPSDNIAPCLAVAESEDLGGKDVVLASVAAYELQCRLCDSADLRHRGWDHVNYGLVSTALSSAKLYGQDRKTAAHAVNIALNGHIAMRQVRAGELSMWKGASFANAARNGVFAAALAREGITGPAPIFEGEMGFFKQVSGEFEIDERDFGGNNGKFKVNQTYVKYWPAEYHAQSAVWSALEVRRQLKEGERVKRILVDTHEAGYSILGRDKEKWSPRTRETADHSLPFIVAVALAKGKVVPSDYSDQGLADETVRRLVEKVEVREDPELTRLYPLKGMPNRVTVETVSGRRLSSRLDLPRGHPNLPMTREDIEKKFTALAGRSLGVGGVKKALRALWGLDSAKNIAEVLETLRVRGPD